MHRADGQWLNPTADGLTAQARYWVDDSIINQAAFGASLRGFIGLVRPPVFSNDE
jgi:hypothetical protein